MKSMLFILWIFVLSNKVALATEKVNINFQILQEFNKDKNMCSKNIDISENSSIEQLSINEDIYIKCLQKVIFK